MVKTTRPYRPRRRLNGRLVPVKRTDSARNGRPRRVFVETGRSSRALLRGALDARSVVGRAYYARLASLRAHVGGEPSVAEARMLDQAARLGLLVDIAWAALVEAQTVLKGNGLHPALEAFLKSARDERAVLSLLGLKRRTRDVPDLQEYLRQKAEEQQHG